MVHAEGISQKKLTDCSAWQIYDFATLVHGQLVFSCCVEVFAISANNKSIYAAW